jgi:nicotinamide riboside kinase
MSAPKRPDNHPVLAAPVGDGHTGAMKVAFVGSFSTGKTTLATLFAKEWDYPLLPEVAREVVELGFPLDQNATAETETLIFLKQWRAETVHEHFVADRSVYDVLAYADWVMEHERAPRKEDHLWVEARQIALLDLRARYDHVFYLPIEFPIVLDGLRPDDTGFQADIDRRIRRLLESADVAYHTLKGPVPARQEEVRATVGGVTVP